MHIFFPSEKKDSIFYISGREYKHLKIRRVVKGEEIGVLWEGNLYRCILIDKNKHFAKAEILEKLESSIPTPELCVYQSVTVNLGTMDFILQKCTELGVRTLTPLITKRSFKDIRVLEKKRDRWERIVREAMKQSARPYPLRIEDCIFLADLQADKDLNLVLDNFSEGLSVRDLSLSGIASINVVIGPEGGFAEEEITILREKGFKPLRLKPHLLRTETATVVIAGLIMNLADS